MKLATIKTISFNSPCYRETAHGRSQMGVFKCEMELFDGGPSKYTPGVHNYSIEFRGEREDGNDFCQHIGMVVQDKALVDYDGVFSLPKEAVGLIESIGVTVSEDFR